MEPDTRRDFKVTLGGEYFPPQTSAFESINSPPARTMVMTILAGDGAQDGDHPRAGDRRHPSLPSEPHFQVVRVRWDALLLRLS